MTKTQPDEMKIIQKIYKMSVFVLIPVAAVSAFFDPYRLPLSILVGGILAVLNLKGLSWGVEGLLGSYKAAGKLVFFSMIRLLLVFLIIAVLAYFKVVNILGIMLGFTLIFIILLVEGLRIAKEDLNTSG